MDEITERVDPDSWVVNGGETARMGYLHHVIWIRNTPQNHQAIRDLLDEFRN